MTQARREGSVLSSLRIGPEPDAVKRRAALHIKIVLAATAAAPAALLGCGYVNQWQPARSVWFAQAAVWFVLAASCVYVIVRSSRKDAAAVRIDFEPGFLTLVRRFSRERIDCSNLAGVRLVYHPVAAGKSGKLGITCRSMKLIFYGDRQPGNAQHPDGDVDGALAVINGDFLLLSHVAEAIHSQVQTVCGHRIEYDAQGDREYRCSQKQRLARRRPGYSTGVVCAALMVTAFVFWLFLYHSLDIARWKNAVAAKGIVTSFEDDTRLKTLHYNYVDEDGRKHSGSAPQGDAPKDAAAGDAIDLFHLPDEPWKSVLALPDWDGSKVAMLILCAILLLVPSWALVLNVCFGVTLTMVNGRPVVMGRDDLEEDYLRRPRSANK